MLKQAIRVGNGAGVLLPRRYLGNIVEIKIRTRTKDDIKKQILNAVFPHLRHVLGIYLVGSYARNEENADSDVDTIIVTNKRIILEVENYHLTCITYEDLTKYMEGNIVEFYPRLMEAETILNESLLQELLKIPITKKNLRWHLESSKSALKVIEKALLTQDKDLIVNDAIVYSLMLRLRQIYLVDCMLSNRVASTQGLIKYAESVKSIERLYNSYRMLRDNEKIKIEISVSEIKEGYDFANEKLRIQERRINELKKEEKTAREKN